MMICMRLFCGIYFASNQVTAILPIHLVRIIMDAEINNSDLERVLSAVKSSYKISSHEDFSNWLQASFSGFVPHQALITAWGDFESAGVDELRLHYELTSNFPVANPQAISATALSENCCMVGLYSLWLSNSRHWYVLDNIAGTELYQKFKLAYPSLSAVTKSLLVYGVNDLCCGAECLYVFFSTQTKSEINSSLVNLMMPHVDHAIRRVQYSDQIKSLDKVHDSLATLCLSEREKEVIQWIKAGKTNQEIGLILNISENTVKSHLKRIFQKLNVGKRAQAVALLANQ